MKPRRPDAPESLWLDALPEPIVPRAALSGDTDADVAIVGAGFTGLWTAFYLSGLDPALRVAVVEARFAGAGASGRNGGWCSGGLAGLEGWLEDEASRPGALALQRAAFDAVDEVGRVARKEGIDCAYRKGGALEVATTAAQEARAQEHLAYAAKWGLDPGDLVWLDAAQTAARVRVAGARGAVFTPHCAVLDPARLVRGLARVVEQRGVRVFEQTRAVCIACGRVETERGTLRAPVVLRATEAYTRSLAGHGRALLPLHSLMVATEPLDDATWRSIGLDAHEAFGDGRRLVTYGQRTADGRIAFGTRGDYRFGSRIEDRFAADDPRFERVRQTLRRLLPQLAGVRFTHAWGGALGVPRSWRPSVVFDRDTGLGAAGGYVGQGVAASNLAGRTLAEHVVGADTERCRMPWVGAASRHWEPEPLRWLAVHGLVRLAASADRAEAAGANPRLRARIFEGFVSH